MLKYHVKLGTSYDSFDILPVFICCSDMKSANVALIWDLGDALHCHFVIAPEMSITFLELEMSGKNTTLECFSLTYRVAI